MKGRVIEVKPVVKAGKLKIVGSIRIDNGGIEEAFLPDREVSSILPRFILAGDKKRVSLDLLYTISPIIRQVICGRKVRVWKYVDSLYFTFFSWKDVTFTEDPGE
ncbi:MAG: hypothetical protein JXB88_20525 [Spirochaetales bacterium]|nr:hypothetical protein [Spirochaetales bacterium]